MEEENQNEFIIMKCGYYLAVDDILNILNESNSKTEIKNKIFKIRDERFNDEESVKKNKASIIKYYNSKTNFGITVSIENDKKRMFILDCNNGTYYETLFNEEFIIKNNYEKKTVTEYELKDLFELNLEKILENFQKITPQN
jgi:hypothetical protein